MLSALSWVPRGFHSTIKPADGLKEEDISPLKQELEEEMGGVNDAIPASQPKKKKDIEIPPELAEFDLEHYDDSDEEIAAAESDEEEVQEGTRMYGAGMTGQIYYANNAEDPYIAAEFEDSDDELDDRNITDEDSVLVSARAGGEEGSALLVNVYDPEKGTTYVHHDIPLKYAPFAMAWCDFSPIDPKTKSNIVAVGGMGNNTIELYDLSVESTFIQPPISTLKPKKKKKKSRKTTDNSIMCLSWNSSHRNILASGSADKIIRVWDMATGECIKEYTKQPGKVQCIAWNKHNPTVLLSGTLRGNISVFDTKNHDKTLVTTNIGSDVESVAWSPTDSNLFMASADNGDVFCFDQRKIERSLFSLHCSSKKKDPVVVSWSEGLPNLLCTVSQSTMECMAWKIDLSTGSASCLASRTFNFGRGDEEDEDSGDSDNEEDDGRLFCASFCPDEPATVAVGGTNGSMAIWDMTENSSVEHLYQDRTKGDETMQIEVPSSFGEMKVE